ncbi:MAG: DUF885 domain-containing protein [Candidatus Krumholzibacteria bacterium]
MKFLSLSLFLLSLLTSLAGCRSTGESEPPLDEHPSTMTTRVTYADESARANAFFEEAFDDVVSRSPMFQSRLGIKDDYDKWDDLSEAHARANLERAKHRLADLERKIRFEMLDEQTKLSYDLFVKDVERQIADFEYRFHTYPLNQMRGWQSVVPAFLINYHRVDSVDDAMAYIERLKNVERLFDQVTENLKVRAVKGIVPPKFVFPYVIEDARNVITGTPFGGSQDDSTILADFKSKVRALDIPDEQKQQLIDRAGVALLMFVRPAYQKLIDYVVELEKTADTRDGVWKLPRGDAFYKHRLQRMTTTELSARRIYGIGLSEVARIHDEMRGVMMKVGFDGTLQEFFTFMREDSQFYYEDTEAGRKTYLEGATRIIDRMRNRLDDLFLIKPQAGIVVKAVEPFREKSTGKAFYQRPSPDGKRPGVYYANLYRMADMPTYQMEALAYHEGIPGHHMQLATAMELEELPSFRRYAGYTAYIEGWGLYSEYIPKEIGFYEDPYADFGRLAMELWRACRLVVDTGIHSKRWSRQRAINYLVQNTPNPRGDVVKAIERYIVMPGQATAYKIGMMRILELREHARETLGDRFDIREFHTLVLKNGPVPLDTLEQLVANWLASKESIQ